MLLKLDDCQLVLVDYQPRLLSAIAEADEVIANAVRLGQAAGSLGVRTWGTEQNPARLGETVPSIGALCNEILPKMHFSACPAGLVELLRRPLQRGRNSIVIGGCEAHICLLQTALDLLQEEFDVWVVTDACGSRTVRNRDAAFDRLAAAGAGLVTTEMVAFEWLRTADHPGFKSVQALIK